MERKATHLARIGILPLIENRNKAKDERKDGLRMTKNCER